MTKVALYARVSTQLQEKERTIESQCEELRRQITKNGDELVKEYIDDGYSGAYLDRPALGQLREDIKTDAFEAVYFLAPDRIARKSVHQDILINELLKCRKRVIINDKDYEKNPENEFALKVFGAVSEFERAKIMERTRRGWMHQLRNGQISAHGATTYGYTYVRKTPTTRQKLVINEKEAGVVRYMFEEYGSGKVGIGALSRTLEQKNILTRKGRQHWGVPHIRTMLTNTTYMGIRRFNRLTKDELAAGHDSPRTKGKYYHRDASEWILVKVPAIVSKTAFNKVQKRLKKNIEHYRRPRVAQLLKGLVKCGECGKSYCSVRAYYKMTRPSGKIEMRHWTSYQCTTKYRRFQHDPTKWKKCHNPRISAHILEERVMRLVKDIMLNPEKLSLCVERGSDVPDLNAARELAHIAERFKKAEEMRRKLINGYAMGRTTHKQFVARSRAIDQDLKHLNQEKIEIVETSRGQNGSSESYIKQFCANALAKFEECIDTETQRAFLHEHIGKIIFMHGRIAIYGSIPTQNNTSLPFHVEGEIDNEQSRVFMRKASQRFAQLQKA